MGRLATGTDANTVVNSVELLLIMVLLAVSAAVGLAVGERYDTAWGLFAMAVTPVVIVVPYAAIFRALGLLPYPLGQRRHPPAANEDQADR